MTDGVKNDGALTDELNGVPAPVQEASVEVAPEMEAEPIGSELLDRKSVV